MAVLALYILLLPKGIAIADAKDDAGQDEAMRRARIRSETIATYEAQLASGSVEESRKANLYFQLAQLHALQERYNHNLEWQIYETRREAEPDAPVEEPPLIFKKSVEYYEKLLRTYPAYEERDKATYSLAMLYLDMKRYPDAGRLLRRFISAYPQSPLDSPARLALGRLLMETESYGELIEVLSPLAALGDEDLTAKVLHQTGWAHIHLQQWEQARECFLTLLSSSSRAKEWELYRNDSIRAIARCVVETSDFRGLQSMGRNPRHQEIAPAIYLEVSRALYGQGRYREAIEIATDFSRRWPFHRELPGVLLAIGTYQKEAQNPGEAIRCYRELRSQVGPGSAWAGSNRESPALLAKADSLARRAELASIEIEWMMIRDGEVGFRCGELLEECLAVLDRLSIDEDDRVDLEHIAATCLFQERRFEEAKQMYRSVVTRGSRGENHSDALYGVLRSNLELFLANPSDEAIVRDLVQASIEFYSEYEESEEARQAIAAVGARLEENGHYQEAIECYLAEFETMGDSERRRELAMSIAHSRYELGQMSEAEDWYLTAAQLDDGVDQEKARAGAAVAAYHQAEVLVKDGMLAEAARRFRYVAETYPEQEPAEAARLQAALTFEEAGDTNQSIDALDAVIDASSQSTGRCLALLKKGDLLLSVDRRREAVTALAEAAEECPDDPSAPAALLRAGTIAVGLGQTDLATAYWNRVLETWASSDAAKTAVARLADGAFETGDWRRSHEYYVREAEMQQTVLSQLERGSTTRKHALERTLQAQYRSGLALLAMDSPVDASEWFARVSTTRTGYSSEVSDYSDYLVARARLELGRLEGGELLRRLRSGSENALKELTPATERVVALIGSAGTAGFRDVSIEANLETASMYRRQAEILLRERVARAGETEHMRRVCRQGTNLLTEALGILLLLQPELSKASTDSLGHKRQADLELSNIMSVATVPESLAAASASRESRGSTEIDQMGQRILDLLQAEMLLDEGSSLQTRIYKISVKEGNADLASRSCQRRIELALERGMLLEETVNLLVMSPSPADLSETEKAMYRERLKERAGDFEDKAVSIYTSILAETATECGGNPTSTAIEERLAHLREKR